MCLPVLDRPKFAEYVTTNVLQSVFIDCSVRTSNRFLTSVLSQKFN